MSTALITLERKVTIKPKPSKSEIVEAMVRVKKHQVEKDKSTARAAMEKLDAELDEMLNTWTYNWFSKCKKSWQYGYLSDGGVCGNLNLTVSIKPKDIPKAILSMVIQRHKLHDEAHRRVDEKALRQVCADSLMASKDSRVDAIVEGAREALESMLKKIGI